ncbi:MAG: tetratricopeptide repeat protein [Terriglobales bacterium]
MAFGFGFNKQKVLSAAEKFVQQGKLQNAITEYEKILKSDAKDLTVLNTVGDLYARLGNNEKAVECFKSVGDAYASQGFTVKAIAMYKKLSKIKSSLECVLRLAELYTQQGLFNDARAQYLQVAEEFLRTGELEQAVRIFQKTLEMDPENVAMRTKLAEVYLKLNKKTEAWQIFSAAAETLRNKGQLPAAEEILQRMLKLDPNSSYALLLRGRNAFDAGDMPAAIQSLEKVADLDSNPDGLRTLLQAYLMTGHLAEAGTLSAKLLAVHNDITAILSYADALIAAGSPVEALQVYQQHSDRLLAADSAKILENLHSLIGPVSENAAALELVLELLNKTADTSHLTEVYELLAHAYVQSGGLEKARDYYLKLTQLEPENQLHSRNYQQVLTKLGTTSSTHLITAEEGAVLVDELEATAPFVDQRYADNVALAVRAALTDAELFISYNMPAKALGPLLSALPLAPRDHRMNQRLAALHTRAGRFTEAAVCCRTLESIYHDAGYPDEATRYGELAAKYEERAAVGMPVELSPIAGSAAPTAADFEVSAGETVPEATEELHSPTVSAAPVESGEPAEFEVQSAPASEEAIDISAEWEGELAEQSAALTEEAVEAISAHTAPPSDEAVAEAVEEIRFYLANGMVEEARAAYSKFDRLVPDHSKFSAVRQEIEAALAQTPATKLEEVSLEEAEGPALTEMDVVAADEPGAVDAPVEDLKSSPEGDLEPKSAKPAAPAELPAVEAARASSKPEPVGVLNEFVSDLEASLGDEFLAAPAAPQPEPKVESHSQKEEKEEKEEKPAPVVAVPAASIPVPAAAPLHAPAAMAAAASQAAPTAPAGTPPTFSYQPTPIQSLAPEAPTSAGVVSGAGDGVDLASMFGELKQELEEDSAATEEDPETHYNLGVAFREMGLLDEAIGELQKVCQSVERGHPFPHVMQTYTWLAQCFLDKGVAEAAIRWYEKALTLSNLDQDTRTALHYELASSYEIAGNKPTALNHFMEVYGSNIDYRDVAERIKPLKS